MDEFIFDVGILNSKDEEIDEVFISASSEEELWQVFDSCYRDDYADYSNAIIHDVNMA